MISIWIEETAKFRCCEYTPNKFLVNWGYLAYFDPLDILLLS
jgi:hypothetical protein